jgi:hypothetical protein
MIGLEYLAQFADRDTRAANRIFAALDSNSDDAEHASWGLGGLGPRIKVIAPRLFAHALNKPARSRGPWDVNEMRAIANGGPIHPAELFKFPESKDIKVTLSYPGTIAKSTDKILLDLKIKNISKRNLRILGTYCGRVGGDAAGLLIFHDPGVPVDIGSSAFGVGGDMGKPVDHTTLLRPDQVAAYECTLQFALSEGLSSSFHYDAMGEGSTELNSDHLLPGRYRIRARYHVTEKSLSADYDWNSFLSLRWGKPWTGDTYSNEIILDVK